MERLVEAIINALGGVPSEIVIFIISLFPILELRGGLIAASILHVDMWKAIPICIAGNILPIPFILLFIEKIFEMLKNTIPESAYQRVSLLGGIIKPNEVVVLVCPVDSEAPEGRLILPQVMAIRDVLDNECICVVLKETHLQQYLGTMPKPALIVTDSQVFGFVSKIVPNDIPLTSFSIVMARLRGDFDNYVKGTPHLSQLKDGDTVLLLESCTHHSTCEDIGRVKLPRMILKFTGKDIKFEYVAGLSPIANPEKYAMAIQCGGCMSTRKQLLNRTNLFVNLGIPISNYGMALAYMNGIFGRVMEPFSTNL